MKKLFLLSSISVFMGLISIVFYANQASATTVFFTDFDTGAPSEFSGITTTDPTKHSIQPDELARAADEAGEKSSQIKGLC